LEIKPIKNARGHHRALKEIESLWGAKPGTPEGDRLDVWIALVPAEVLIQPSRRTKPKRVA